MTPLQKTLRAMGTAQVQTGPAAQTGAIGLLTTKVAGTSHIDDLDAILADLEPDDRLSFTRDPDNPFDPRAVQILDSHRRRIGFLPRDDNETVSNLLDAGKNLYAVVSNIDAKARWADISITVYLEDR